LIVGIAAAGGNVFRWTCVESSTLPLVAQALVGRCRRQGV